MKHRPAVVGGLLALTLIRAAGLAQPDTDGDSSLVRLEGGGFVDENTVRTARETVSHSVTLPSWTNPRGPMSSLRAPSMQRWNTAYNPDDPNSNPTNGYRGDGYETMHVQVLLDDGSASA